MFDTATSGGPVRTAVVGYGLAGSAFHAPLIAATDGLALTTVVTSNDERAAAARERYPDVTVVPTVDELLRRRDDIDLVVVASPNSSHVPIGLAALGAGLPVVIDKPVAATVAAASQLRAAAVKNNLLISVYHNRRWDGDARTLRALLAQGLLGTVHRFESRYERWRPQVDASRWREQPGSDVAGGLLYDLGSHLIDQALVLFGPVDSVYAEVGGVRAGAKVDDDVFLALTHANGVRSHLWASAVAADFGPRLRVLGSAGSYVKYGMDVQEDALRSGGTPRDPGWGVEPEAAWGQLGEPGSGRSIPTEAGAYQDFYREIRDALRNGAPPPVTIDEAIEVLAVIEAARRSADEGVTVRM
ncbi:Gfo/Idh/MocA family oxidoreductase [Planosporangium flavigriseum]|uniref:Oxidoreductase n=1 Tax=Planosporangium flavigriseum TaxID=373681 RepID=A0A8J3PK95_9ACTN|nr:Gfo/Idh/MocA family oxidoreductase [Planosporangium flavigriseum]NJC63003.1 Gfo/Idh/MocA family oxidoreductase [Planosporangium flavigriseum]GIG73126.1 oxidoreductase [Planosporangium flavigriseum]